MPNKDNSNEKIIGICKLCKLNKELRLSHIIPKAVFRRMYRDGRGSGIQITDDETTPNKATSNTWSEHLLCEGCEEHFNKELEHKAITMFIQDTKWSKQNEYGLTISNYEMTRLGNFFISIIWRAAVSTRTEFYKVNLTEELRESIRIHLLKTPAKLCKIFSIQLWHLYDPYKHMSADLMKGITISPTCTILENKIIYHLIILGVYAQLHYPFDSKLRKNKANLDYKKKIFLIPRKSLFNVEILDQPSRRAIFKSKFITEMN